MHALLIVVAALLPLVYGHSWIACTDYMEEDGWYWDQSLCRAFARHGHQYTPRTEAFGTDKGYNYHASESQVCRTPRSDNEAYNDAHPMPVYYPGQKVVIAHPTKNHVADVGCTNKYIPDHGSHIYIGPRDGVADLTLSEFRQNEIADLGISPFGWEVADEVTRQYPKPGYQNAPAFCENMDKALATYAFTIPQTLYPGRYTFVWTWGFNSRDDLYSSCWEADVVESRDRRDDVLRARGLDTSDLGSTSNTNTQTGNTDVNTGNDENDYNDNAGQTDNGQANNGQTDTGYTEQTDNGDGNNGQTDSSCQGSGAANTGDGNVSSQDLINLLFGSSGSTSSNSGCNCNTEVILITVVTDSNGDEIRTYFKKISATEL